MLRENKFSLINDWHALHRDLLEEIRDLADTEALISLLKTIEVLALGLPAKL